MRIRGRSLPFPPLIPSPSPSTPLKSESATTADQYPTTTTAGFDRAEAKDELLTLLHPNAARRSALSPPPPCAPTSSTQFLWKKEEPAEDDDDDEKKNKKNTKKKKGGENEIFPESNSDRLNAKFINTVNRATSTGCQDKDMGKPADCTMVKNKQKEVKAMAAKEKKTMRNSAVLLEGSRCSRVNGRGWRCCQPTLVGYLLCEHHLGKGRTRNMISNATRGQLGCTESKRNLFEGGSADEAARKKRNVVPTVKARSISSLLDDGAGH